MKPEKDYLVAFAGIDQLWSIHAEVQPTEIGNTSDANCEERSKSILFDPSTLFDLDLCPKVSTKSSFQEEMRINNI